MIYAKFHSDSSKNEDRSHKCIQIGQTNPNLFPKININYSFPNSAQKKLANIPDVIIFVGRWGGVPNGFLLSF